LLREHGAVADQTEFVRLIAANAKSDIDHILAGRPGQGD